MTMSEWAGPARRHHTVTSGVTELEPDPAGTRTSRSRSIPRRGRPEGDKRVVRFLSW
jgi:hypothetical protein